MTTAIQLLRSPVANLRPLPGTLDDGMPMVNTNAAQPGLFFKLEGGSELTKIGPAAVGPQAPNLAPAGFAGNARGEFWYDTVNSTLKIWDGTQWQDTTNDTQVQLSDLLGVAQTDSGLGTFSGSTIGDGSTIKAALQALETKAEAVQTALDAVDLDTNDFAALVGISENITNLGSFSGSTISGTTVKAALQDLETALELRATQADLTSLQNTVNALPSPGTAASLHIDDLLSALGVNSEEQDFGTFSGTILQNNNTLKQLLEQLEDGIEARASPAVANIFQGEHTLRDKLHLDPGDGGMRLQLNRNVSATQFDILLGNVPSGARLNINTVNANADDALVVYSSKFWCRALGGGTGDAEFDGDVLVDGTLTVGSTNLVTELGLKAAINNTTLTGTLDAEAGDFSGALTVDNDGGFYLKFDRNTSTQLDIITGNIPSGGNLNIKNSNGNNAKVVVYSDLFWCRNLGGSSGNGTAQFDGDVTCGSEIKMTNDYTDKAAAGAGALGDIAVIGGALCFHDGTDWKTVTLGAAPS